MDRVPDLRLRRACGSATGTLIWYFSGAPAKALEQSRHLQAAQHIEHVAGLKRRQTDGGILEHFDIRAARPADDQRAEGLVEAHTQDHLDAILDQFRNQDAIDPRLRAVLARIGEHCLRGGRDFGGRLGAEMHAANVGFVRDIGRLDLERHGVLPRLGLVASAAHEIAPADRGLDQIGAGGPLLIGGALMAALGGATWLDASAQHARLAIGAIRGPDPERIERARRIFPVPLSGTASEQAIRERRLVTYSDVLHDRDVPDGLRQR